MWNQSSGTKLAVLQEQVTTSVALPLTENNATTTIISGSLPSGLRLLNNVIVGTPYEVSRNTEFKFVIRATYNSAIKDRTFSIEVQGADDPVWQTPEDLLAVGPNNTFFILDSALVDYQLSATDTDTKAGQKLEYFIASGDGELPPGIQLTTDGKIVGIVDPILAIEKGSLYGDGNYDTGPYDIQNAGYDFGIRSNNGFDSYFFDTTIYDYNIPTKAPKKLNRYYQFKVSVSDGESIVKRTFRIYVVGDDFLKADNTVLQIGTNTFKADNTNIRVPVWLTPADLGYRRANNYVTLFLDTIDSNSLTGVVSYLLQSTNPDTTPSKLPPGLSLDSTTGEIAGRVPYQPAVTVEYKFTVRASRFTPDQPEEAITDKTFTVKLLGEVNSTITWKTDTKLSDISSNYISTLSVTATTNVPNGKMLYSLNSGRLPPGLRINYDGQIIGKINSFGTSTNIGLTVFDSQGMTFDANTTSIDRTYEFVVKAQDQFGYSAKTKKFSITVSDPDDKFYSNLFVKPLMKKEKRQLFLNYMSDVSMFDPDNIYRPDDPNFGLQKEIKMLVYAGIETKLAKNYVSAIAKNHKRKSYKLGEVKKAVAKNPGSTATVYELVYIDVIDPAESTIGKVADKLGVETGNKITIDSVKHDPENQYYDWSEKPNVPVRIRPGKEAVITLGNTFDVSTRTQDYKFTYSDGLFVYTRATVDNKKGIAINPGKGPNMRFRPVPKENTIKSDSDAVTIDSNYDNTKYISNITNMRDKIRTVGSTEGNFQPLWMRTAQGNNIAALGFTNAIPLCYCKPGKGDTVMTAIKNNTANFSQFHFDIDRYIIDSTTGIGKEQYLLFANYRFNV